MLNTIFLSAGHYPDSDGYVNSLRKLSEHSQASRIVQHIMEARVLPTIVKVPSANLNTKVNFINHKACPGDIAIELHFNASENVTANGTETLYYTNSVQGKILAQVIQLTLMQYLPFTDRGIKTRSDLKFLRGTIIPAIIVEILFLSNMTESSYLLHRRSIHVIANALSSGMVAYLTNN